MTRGKKRREESCEPIEPVTPATAAESRNSSVEMAEDTAVTVEPAAEITRLETELAAANDKILRTHAEFDNFRKRTFKDIANTRAMTQADTALPFLHLFDNVAMAIASAEQATNMEAIMQGLRMIVGEYERAIGDLGITKIDAVGKKFDPTVHEAIAHEPSDEVPEGVVLKQWNCGYKLGERLLRPARVVVSSGPEQSN
ncbi:MAG: nucleotide exchange factor GrpE [Victivallales bacterium]|nr:nucleotide exchange factor GrpE [Victivallales bacterium]